MEVDEEPYQAIRTALAGEDKRNVSLQELPKDFFDKALEYLEHLREEVRSALEAEQDNADVLRAYQEYQQARESLEKLVDRRLQKVLEMARRSARPGADVAPQRALPRERELFDQVVEVIGTCRDALLGSSRAQTRTVLVLQDLPSVTGTDLRVYELKEGDVATLPDEMAELLVERKAARELELPAKRRH